MYIWSEIRVCISMYTYVYIYIYILYIYTRTTARASRALKVPCSWPQGNLSLELSSSYTVPNNSHDMLARTGSAGQVLKVAECMRQLILSSMRNALQSRRGARARALRRPPFSVTEQWDYILFWSLDSHKASERC